MGPAEEPLECRDTPTVSLDKGNGRHVLLLYTETVWMGTPKQATENAEKDPRVTGRT